MCITSTAKLVLERSLTDNHHLDVVNQRDTHGNTPFLVACAHGCGARSTLRLFVEQGSNIHDQNYDGETCLHLVCRNSRCHLDTEMLRDCLDFLLEQGADLRATDNKGCSVADAAYLDMGERFRDLTSPVGDAFDACLVSHGYDIYEFRKGKPRVARYSRLYQRKDFELLWKGIEDGCPYWDDKPWPTNENEQSRKCDSSDDSEVEIRGWNIQRRDGF